jgi:hypothetical protein
VALVVQIVLGFSLKWVAYLYVQHAAAQAGGKTLPRAINVTPSGIKLQAAATAAGQYKPVQVLAQQQQQQVPQQQQQPPPPQALQQLQTNGGGAAVAAPGSAAAALGAVHKLHQALQLPAQTHSDDGMAAAAAAGCSVAAAAAAADAAHHRSGSSGRASSLPGHRLMTTTTASSAANSFVPNTVTSSSSSSGAVGSTRLPLQITFADDYQELQTAPARVAKEAPLAAGPQVSESVSALSSSFAAPSAAGLALRPCARSCTALPHLDGSVEEVAAGTPAAPTPSVTVGAEYLGLMLLPHEKQHQLGHQQWQAQVVTGSNRSKEE